MAPFAKSLTQLTLPASLTSIEMARINFMKSELIRLGIQVESNRKGIRIFPGTPHKGIITSRHDRYIAMAFSLIGLKIPGMIIDEAECVTELYPRFFY